MTDDREAVKIDVKEYISEKARALVLFAKSHGYILTVEQVSLQPPAMGNYETVVEVRERRTQ